MINEGDVLDPNLEKMGNLFLVFHLDRFTTFGAFMDDPGPVFRRCAQRGDFWPGDRCDRIIAKVEKGGNDGKISQKN